MISFWAAFKAIPGRMQPTGHGLDTPAKFFNFFPFGGIGHTARSLPHEVSWWGGLRAGHPGSQILTGKSFTLGKPQLLF